MTCSLINQYPPLFHFFRSHTSCNRTKCVNDSVFTKLRKPKVKVTFVRDFLLLSRRYRENNVGNLLFLQSLDQRYLCQIATFNLGLKFREKFRRDHSLRRLPWLGYRARDSSRAGSNQVQCIEHSVHGTLGERETGRIHQAITGRNLTGTTLCFNSD